MKHDSSIDANALIQACLDGSATDAELDRLEGLLRADPAVRDEYLQLADMHACLAVDEQLWTAQRSTAAAASLQSPEQGSRLLRRPLPAAVAGLVVGLLSASLTFGYVLPFLRSRVVLVDESFDSGPPPRVTGMSSVAGIWNGDYSRVVGVDQGVTPLRGSRMLHLLRADYEGKPEQGSSVADQWQLIDLRPYRADIAGGGVTARIVTSFNAAACPVGETYKGSFSLYALDARTAESLRPTDAASIVDASLAMSQKTDMPIDGDLRTWQSVGGELDLPVNTEYLMVRVGVAHATLEQRREDFPGHYLDEVRLTLETRGGRSP